MLERLQLTGFKSIAHLDLKITALNILIGPNGAGKSNFLSFFKLMHALSLGRFHEFVESEGGGSSFLFAEGDRREITATITCDDRDSKVRVALRFRPAPPDQLIVQTIRTHVPATWLNGKTKLPTPRARRRAALQALSRRYFLEWLNYHFHDTGPRARARGIVDATDNQALWHDGGNVASVLAYLKREAASEYDLIVQNCRLVAPYFVDFNVQPQRLNEKTILLRWTEHGSPTSFGAHQMSDGMLRFVMLATLLNLPEVMLPKMLVIDEPELGLHPAALQVVAALLQRASERCQVVVATQSTMLLDLLMTADAGISNVIVVDRQSYTNDKGSDFRRLKASALSSWLSEYSPGQLWVKGILGGSPVA